MTVGTGGGYNIWVHIMSDCHDIVALVKGEHEMRKTVWMLALAVSAAVCGAEKTVTVREGASIGLAEALSAAGLTLEAGDTLVKKGPGRLVGSSAYKALNVNLRIVEGVFEGNTPEQFFASGVIAVRDGATLDLRNTGNNSVSVMTNRSLYLAGAGSAAATVTENGRPLTGALLIRGNVSWQLLQKCHFWLDGADATIACAVAGNNGYLTSAWIGSKDGTHTLTLLGPGHTLDADGNCSVQYQHRFRWGSGFTNMTGRIVIDGASLTAHDVNYKVHPKAFPLEVKSGGTFGPEGTSFSACFSEVDFEWGSIIAGETVAATPLPPFTGFPAISTKTTATIDNAWTVRAAELVAGHSLVAYRNPLTFGPNATVTLTESELLDVDTVYTLARADASISGCPALVHDAGAAPRWRVVAGADGMTLQLVYALPDLPGLVNVRDWGVLPGADRAEANVTAFAEGLAALDDGTEHILFFPQGTYSFAAPVPVSGRRRLTLLGDNGFSRLAVAETASGVLAVSDAEAITVTGFTLSGGTGAALAARGVSGLVVTNNVFADVPGVSAGEGETGTFPVRAEDCADALVRENLVTGGAVYAGPVLAVGTTTLADGTEPGADEVVLYAPLKRTDRYRTRPFAEALSERGLAAYPQGARLVKRGLGKLGGPTASDVGNRLGPIDIREGTFVGTVLGSLGPSGNTVTAQDGATVLLEPGKNACAASNTTFTLGGTGASATDAQAVLCLRKVSWQYTLSSTFVLRSDATFRFIDEDSIGIFSEGVIDQNGHTLTLKGDRGRAAGAFRFRVSTLFRNSGPIVVRNTMLTASWGKFTGENGVRPPLLKICSDAGLRVHNQDFADVFALYDFEPGGRWEAESAQALVTANLKGAPELAGSVTLSVTNAYTARAADLVQGAKMTAVNALAFGAACVADVEGVENLPFTDAGYVLATSGVAISGRPRAGAALKEAGWTTALSADGRSLLLKPLGGLAIFLR